MPDANTPQGTLNGRTRTLSGPGSLDVGAGYDGGRPVSTTWREIPLQAAVGAPSEPAFSYELLHLHLGAGLFELGLALFGVFLRHLLEHRLRRAVDEVLGLLEAQARELAHDLDHLDLLVARRGEDHVELVLLFGSLGGGATATTGGCDRDRRGCRDAELLFERLEEVVQ